MSTQFVFVIYASWRENAFSGITLTILAGNEKEAIEKAKRIISCDEIKIVRVVERVLYKKEV